MNYDIVPIKRAYRGIDRALLATDLLTKRTKKKYNTLLERYTGFSTKTVRQQKCS